MTGHRDAESGLVASGSLAGNDVVLPSREANWLAAAHYAGIHPGFGRAPQPHPSVESDAEGARPAVATAGAGSITARPALILVESTPRPGRRAIEFIRWAISNHGTTTPAAPGQVTVTCSQAALTLAYDHVASAGTVAWYMAQLRQAGIVVRTRPAIVVDLDALHHLDPPDRPPRPTDPGPLADSVPDVASSPTTGNRAEVGADQHAPSLAALFARQAEQLGRAVQVLAELAATQAEIARTLAAQAAPTRDSASPALAESAPIREFAESRLADPLGRRKDVDQPPTFLDSRIANLADQRLATSRPAATAPWAGDDTLADQEVDEIVEPLRAWCRANGRSDRLDRNGRRTLAPLGRGPLTAGVTAIQQEAATDPTIRSPLGLLIDRARRCDPDTFTPTPADADGADAKPEPTAVCPFTADPVDAIEADMQRRTDANQASRLPSATIGAGLAGIQHARTATAKARATAAQGASASSTSTTTSPGPAAAQKGEVTPGA